MAKILIIEDEYILTKLYEVVFEQKGHQVIGTAFNTNEARKKISELKPDLVILDLHLRNNESGIELIDDIHQSKAKAVVVTADDNKKLEETVRQKGVAAYFKKPLNRKEFLETVENLLSK